MAEIRINSFLKQTGAEGPGVRFCIWVQGCSIKCKGCANFNMWDVNGGEVFPVEEIVKLIEQEKNQIDGITFLGGEPLNQIEAVVEISKAAKEMGLNVLVFTGYRYPEIKDRGEIKELIKNIDILIDGKFEEELKDFSRPWVGSSNQNYYFFTDKYNESILKEYKNKIEIRIDKNNKVILNGMGDFNALAINER